jgi:hypothetical protein
MKEKQIDFALWAFVSMMALFIGVKAANCGEYAIAFMFCFIAIVSASCMWMFKDIDEQ